MAKAMRVHFADLVFDSGTRLLTRSGQQVELSPKAFELLEVLLEHRPDAVSRDDLMARVWPDTHVSRTSLARLVNEIRSVLCDDARTPSCVRTVHGFGYAFSGAVEETASGDVAAPAEACGCWLERGTRTISLPVGLHVIGRDPDVSVPIASTKASRRHAQIRVTGSGAMLEDLDSKNGSFLNGEPVDGGVALEDGGEICVGDEVFVFRFARCGARTETATKR